MKVYLISGDGFGAGKSTLARKLGDEVWSIAGALREDLKRQYPNYDWFNKDGDYKKSTRVREYGDGRKYLRDVMIEYGQAKCDIVPTYWVSQLADRLTSSMKIHSGARIFAIDDVRKMCELDLLKSRFHGLVTHFHLATESAGPEPQYENGFLREKADYLVKWTPTK